MVVHTNDTHLTPGVLEEEELAAFRSAELLGGRQDLPDHLGAAEQAAEDRIIAVKLELDPEADPAAIVGNVTENILSPATNTGGPDPHVAAAEADLPNTLPRGKNQQPVAEVLLAKEAGIEPIREEIRSDLLFADNGICVLRRHIAPEDVQVLKRLETIEFPVLSLETTEVEVKDALESIADLIAKEADAASLE